METHLQKELKKLEKNLLEMAALVEMAVSEAVQSLVKRDSDLAQKTFEAEEKINTMEIAIGDSRLKVLALKHPVAADLRFITSAMKIITNLERMGDEAVNIAERAISLNQEPQLKSYLDIPKMAEITQSMVKDVLNAFVNRDSNLARSVLETDDLIDKLNDQVMRELLTYVSDDPLMITKVIHLMRVCRCLERIGDHAANIAEDVIFMTDALDNKHHADSGLNNRMSD